MASSISDTARVRRARIKTPEVFANVPSVSRVIQSDASDRRSVASARDLKQIQNRQEAEAMDEVMAPRVNARDRKKKSAY